MRQLQSAQFLCHGLKVQFVLILLFRVILLHRLELLSKFEYLRVLCLEQLSALCLGLL